MRVVIPIPKIAHHPEETQHGPILVVRRCGECRADLGRELWPWDRMGDGETTGLCRPCYDATAPDFLFEDADPGARYMAPVRREAEAEPEPERVDWPDRIGAMLLTAAVGFSAATITMLAVQLLRYAIRAAIP